MTGTLIQIAILVLIPASVTIFKWFQQKRIAMDAERAKRDREQAILRTGRDPQAEAAERARRAQQQANQRPDEADLMADRQEALRQLRREQAEAANQQREATPTPTGGGGGRTLGPGEYELWPGGPIVRTTPAPAPASPNANRPMPRTQQELRRPQQRQKAKPVQKRQQQQPQREQPRFSTQAERDDARHDDAYYERERSLARMKASTNVEATAAKAAPVFTKPTTAQQWRAALIAAEVLGTPVAMRDPANPIGCPTR